MFPVFLAVSSEQICTIVTVLIAAATFVFQFSSYRREQREKEEQRMREWRWTQFARCEDIIEKALADPALKASLRMIDWSGCDFKLPSGKDVTVSQGQVSHALRIDNLFFDETETLVRDSFDALFDSFARIEPYISNGFIQGADAAARFAYYVKKMDQILPAARKFLRAYHPVSSDRFYQLCLDPA
jgi:hypothetical protein